METTTQNTQSSESQICEHMTAHPEKQHEWLGQLLGEWAYEGEATMERGQPPQKFTGTESVRSLQGLWTIGEGHGKTPDGSPATTITTLGYDPGKGRFVGTFIGSMMTHLWIYEGQLDESGRVLTLDTEGPNWEEGGSMVRMRDILEIIDENHRILRSEMLGDDGQYQEFMEAHYRRV